MSDAVKKVIPIYLVLIIYLFINILINFTSLANVYISFLNPIFLFLISLLVYSITKNFRIRNRNKYSKSKNVIIIIIAYFLIYYLSGLIFGFLDNGLTIKTIFSSFISCFLIVLFKEYIRYRLICISKKKNNLFFVIILFILLDINFINLFSSSGFIYFLEDIISIIIMNITSTYLIYKVGSIPNYLYKGIFTGINLFLPIVPNHNWIVTNFFLLSLLIIIVFSIDYLINLEERGRRKYKKDNPVVSWVFFIIAFIFILFMMGFFKYQPIAILSNSMKDYYTKGDAVIVEKIDEENIPFIKKDDIIYYRYDGRYITHRVYDIRIDNGSYIFYTKGDNNESVDSWEVMETDIVGIVKFRIKYVGWPSVWLYELLS